MATEVSPSLESSDAAGLGPASQPARPTASGQPASSCEEAQVPRFYAGRSVLVTGGTGFLGKVVIGRLLATCPEVAGVVVVVRPRPPLSVQDRLQQLKASEVFASVSRRQLDKLRAVQGDCTRPRLGIDDETVAQLCEVSVMLHCAANIRFNSPLERAVPDNVGSAFAALALADSLPNLEVLLHVSTAYCEAEHSLVEERVYTQQVSGAQLQACATLPPTILRDITPRLLGGKPNTYTLTKAVAESVMAEHAPRHYAVAIFRPTIVVSSAAFPSPGWCDSWAGPLGAAAACGRGVLRVFRASGLARADLLPVDVCADGVLCVGWDVRPHRCGPARVYTWCSGAAAPTWGTFRDAVRAHARELPLGRPLWYPCVLTTGNRLVYLVLELVLQTAPLYLLEVVNTVRGVKDTVSPSRLRWQLRALHAALGWFALRSWQFQDTRAAQLRARLALADAALYTLRVQPGCWDEHFRNMMVGARRHLLHEKDEDIPEAKRHMARLRLLHYSVMCVAAALLLRALLLLFSSVAGSYF